MVWRIRRELEKLHKELSELEDKIKVDSLGWRIEIGKNEEGKTVYATLEFDIFKEEWYVKVYTLEYRCWTEEVGTYIPYEKKECETIENIIAEGYWPEIRGKLPEQYSSVIGKLIEKKSSEVSPLAVKYVRLRKRYEELSEKLRTSERELRQALKEEILKLPAPNEELSEEEIKSIINKVTFSYEWWEPLTLLLYVGPNRVEIALETIDVDEEGKIAEIPEDVKEIAIRLWFNKKKRMVGIVGPKIGRPVRLGRFPTRYAKFVREVEEKIEDENLRVLLLKWWTVAKHEFGKVADVSIEVYTVNEEVVYEYYVELPSGVDVTWHYNREWVPIRKLTKVVVSVKKFGGGAVEIPMIYAEGRLYEEERTEEEL